MLLLCSEISEPVGVKFYEILKSQNQYRCSYKMFALLLDVEFSEAKF